MYCPKCGAENQEDIAYCRNCGEDLKIISQAMKKHLSVAIVSKLDAAIENKNERLRRDAIMWAFWGVAFSILMVSGGMFFTTPIFPILGTLLTLLFLGYFFLSSAMYFLAYRRSLEMKTKRFFISADDQSLSDTSQFGILPDASGTETNKLITDNDSQSRAIYCPRCGVQNEEKVQFCRNCGGSLNFSFSPTGLEKYLPAFLIRRLDLGIARNEKEQSKYKTGWGLIRGTSFWLLLAFMAAAFQDWVNMAFWSLVFLSRFVIHGWDFLQYRRSKKYLDDISVLSTEEFPMPDTRDSFEFLQQRKDLPVPDEILWEDSQGTKETLPLESSLSSSNEATTKSLDTVVGEIDETRIPIVKNKSRR